jgi:hypothetical protein
LANHYDVIGVGVDASTEQIRAAYRQRLREVHPDFHHDASPEVLEKAKRDTVELNEAWYTLSDPERRGKYDMAHLTPEDLLLRFGSGPPPVTPTDGEGSLCPHCGARNATSDEAERATCRSCKIEYGLSTCRFCRTTTPLPLDQDLYRCPGCHKSERPPWASFGKSRPVPRPTAASPTVAAAAGSSPGVDGSRAKPRRRPRVRLRQRLSASGMLTGAGWVIVFALLVAIVGTAAAVGDVTVITVQLLALIVLAAWLKGRHQNRRR